MYGTPGPLTYFIEVFICVNMRVKDHDTLLFLLLVTYTKMLLFFVYCRLFECCEMHSVNP